ncbi:MAG: uroporphyrinogen decarboxylase family protein [Spirochaetota bacterium]
MLKAADIQSEKHTGVMTSRERTRCSLSHKEPDRLPVSFGALFTGATSAMQGRIADVLGIRGERDPRFTQFDNRIQEYFGCDLRLAPGHWGRFRKDENDFPLRTASLEDVYRYAWPKPHGNGLDRVVNETRFLHRETDYFIVAPTVAPGIFEAGCWLRGYDQWLMDIAADETFVRHFNDIYLSVITPLIDEYFGAVGKYIDLVIIGDDLATQSGPYISPEHFRALFKPYFKAYIEAVGRHCPRAFIGHHCCGSSFQLMDDLKDIGVDLINPVQTTAKDMHLENLVTRKKDFSFLGGVDLQHVLPYGTTEEVAEFVRSLIRTLAPGGGYVLGPCHTLPDDVRPENVITMLETAREAGGWTHNARWVTKA